MCIIVLCDLRCMCQILFLKMIRDTLNTKNDGQNKAVINTRGFIKQSRLQIRQLYVTVAYFLCIYRAFYAAIMEQMPYILGYNGEHQVTCTWHM